MTMTSRFTKVALTAHVIVSVGWLGAVAAYLALAIAGLTIADALVVRGAYRSMALIGWLVIVPFSLAALGTGLLESLGTRWGLFRHWWILVKVLLTIGGIAVLLRHMTAVSRMSALAAQTTFATTDFSPLRVQLLIHAVGGLMVLLTATTLSVYKPWGMTSYGRRTALASDLGRHRDADADASARRQRQFAPCRPRWVSVVGIHAIALIVVVVVRHLANGGLRGH
jgi:hypothetical protein